jgi:hypothetical protein
MLVLSPEETSTIRATVKALAEERDSLKRRLEAAELQLHRYRIVNDELRRKIYALINEK